MAPAGHIRLQCPPRCRRARGGAAPASRKCPGVCVTCRWRLVDSQELPSGLSPRDQRTLSLICSPGAARLPLDSTAMSKLGKFFKGGGSSKSRAAPSPQEALARLRETEEMLGKKQDYLESRIQKELALAKKHGTQNKRGRLGVWYQA